jgi:hypothetical protein
MDNTHTWAAAAVQSLLKRALRTAARELELLARDLERKSP